MGCRVDEGKVEIGVERRALIAECGIETGVQSGKCRVDLRVEWSGVGWSGVEWSGVAGSLAWSKLE